MKYRLIYSRPIVDLRWYILSMMAGKNTNLIRNYNFLSWNMEMFQMYFTRQPFREEMLNKVMQVLSQDGLKINSSTKLEPFSRMPFSFQKEG
jgi:hypothetical protein